MLQNDILMILAYSLGVALVVHRVLIKRLPQFARSGLVAAGVLASLPILNGLSFAEWLRGGLGELSVTTLLLLGGACTRAFALPHFSVPRWHLSLGLLPLGGLIYFDTLTGIGPNFYAFGYSHSFIWGAITLAASLYFLRQCALGWWLIIVVLSWNLHLLHSNNFFDYLIDVPLWIALMFYCIRNYFSKIRSN